LTVVVGTVTVAALLVAGVATAASVAVSPRSTGGSRTTPSRCDATPGAWTLAYTETPAGNITAVKVSGINPACNGGTLYLSLTNGTTVQGAGPATGTTISAATASVTLTSTPLYSTVTKADVAVVGP
jgi:hypothetical protein